jgi:hypothetical protein
LFSILKQNLNEQPKTQNTQNYFHLYVTSKHFFKPNIPIKKKKKKKKPAKHVNKWSQPFYETQFASIAENMERSNGAI